MSSPLSFLIEHENTILKAYGQNNSKPKATWISLEKGFPQLSRVMTFNTFKQYVSVFAFIKTELDKVRQNEINRLEKENDQFHQKLCYTLSELDKVIQNKDNMLNKMENFRMEKLRLEIELNSFKAKLDKVRQSQELNSQVRQGLDKKPKRISGWSVQYSKDGYYRCNRKIEKKVHSVYLGKKLDLKKAQNRIDAKEKSLGLV